MIVSIFFVLQGARTAFNKQISLFEITVTVQLPPFFQTAAQLSQYLAKSVFIMNIGSNDYINNYLLPNKYISSHIYSGEAFADLLVNIFTQQLSVILPPGCETCLPLQKPCENRNQYIFWDSYHPTQAVNAIIAQGCYTEAATGCYPISIRQLAQHHHETIV